MIEIVIGRDGSTSQLKISIGQQSKLFGAQGSVPQTVSRQHCSITVNDNGTFTLKNLKLQNVTFVNGQQVDTKIIKENDTIELGPNKYLVSWNTLKSVIPAKAEVVSIEPLKKIWDRYQLENEKVEIRKQQLAIKKQKQNLLRGLTGIFIPLAIVLSVFAGGRDNPLFILLYSLPGIITLMMTISQYNNIKEDESSIISDREQKKERDLRFRRDYSCPKCGKYLSMPYDVLERYDSCPYCKVKFRA
ncbi:MAG: FHA domain-containing protein [Prevotella sp.]|nr:FHA domain-containing protein [Prevotella sp.]